MEWRGFGTEEDDEYLANVDLFSSSSMFGQPSYYSPTLSQSSPMTNVISSDDYQIMHADDAVFDSFDFDVSVFLDTDSVALIAEPKNSILNSSNSCTRHKSDNCLSVKYGP